MSRRVFQYSDLLCKIKCNVKEQEIQDLVQWLSRAPGYTTFRINTLRKFDIDTLREYLTAQMVTFSQKTALPETLWLSPDCLVLGSWPSDLKLDSSSKEVIVDAACAAAVLRGAHVFAPGVMGMPTNCQLDELVDIYGDIEGKCKKGLKVPFDGPKLFVGMGRLKMLRSNLFDQGIHPSGIAIETLLPASRIPVVNERIYPSGTVLLQNLPSIVCGWVLNPKENENILDMCAAPGNKTTHIGEITKNKGNIIAIDKTPQRVRKITENAAIHGLTCIKPHVYDSTKIYSEHSNGISNGPPFPANSFEKILLDAPCSGLGQRPQLYNQMTPKMLDSYKHVQRKLFENACMLLKPHGRLVYSTCTITAAENESMVAWVLDKLPSLKLVSAEPLMGGPGWAGCGLDDQQRQMVQRFGPETDPLRLSDNIYKDTIGFFIACFEKRSDVCL